MAEKGPVRLFNQAVKAVKGDSAELVEAFTAEMTLVAEGLVEDQARLRREVEALAGERQSFRSELEALESELNEHQKETDRRLEELSRRVEALSKPAKGEKGRGREKFPWLDKLIILAGIVCGSWVLVTLINLFR